MRAIHSVLRMALSIAIPTSEVLGSSPVRPRSSLDARVGRALFVRCSPLPSPSSPNPQWGFGGAPSGSRPPSSAPQAAPGPRPAAQHCPPRAAVGPAEVEMGIAGPEALPSTENAARAVRALWGQLPTPGYPTPTYIPVQSPRYLPPEISTSRWVPREVGGNGVGLEPRSHAACMRHSCCLSRCVESQKGGVPPG
mmetsp:Transcript_40450/g.72375  ORF Transcript_40450/g.72375 Transcript_40450/m.72375 type:complete len:195 (-) Transcript_40450:498-1082(-)